MYITDLGNSLIEDIDTKIDTYVVAGVNCL